MEKIIARSENEEIVAEARKVLGQAVE